MTLNQIKCRVYRFSADPGHGWLAVPRKILETLNVVGISSYSYQKGGTVYLEEDCDLSRFLVAFKAQFGHDPTIKESWTNRHHWVRSYEHYRA